MSQRNLKRPKLECPHCHAMVRQLSSHVSHFHVSADVKAARREAEYQAERHYEGE